MEDRARFEVYGFGFRGTRDCVGFRVGGLRLKLWISDGGCRT